MFKGKFMSRQMKVAIGALALLLGLVFGVLYFIESLVSTGLKNYSPPPVTVSVAEAKSESWERLIRSVGTLTAVNGVEITSEVGGLIKEIYFASGIDVEEGQVLVQLDDSVEQANLRSYVAQHSLAEINYIRDKKLFKSQAISKTDIDTVEAKLKDAEAQMQRTQALIDQKKILAPFSGRLGIRRLNVGDYVKSGDQLVTLQALAVLYVDFYVPEQHVPKLFPGQLVRFTVQAFEDRIFEAKVIAVNAKVDQNTRNILVRAAFDNDAEELVPGMFANLDVVLDQQQAVISVPQSSINYSLYGNSVYVAKPVEPKQAAEATDPPQAEKPTTPALDKDIHDGKEMIVERRYIKVSGRREGRVAITEGVAEGEVVVTSGQLKLNNGARVIINNSVAL